MKKYIFSLAVLLAVSLTVMQSRFLMGATTTNESSLLLPPQMTFTVTNTNDSGAGSFRQAILDSNASIGTTDTITFNIAGAGVHTISPASELPTITDPVIIDGYTQPGASANTLATGNDAVLLIELNGMNLPILTNALLITSGNTTVRGLVINRFMDSGIVLEIGDGNVIAGNFIGTNAAGTAAAPNANNGVWVRQGSANNLIGGTTPAARNVISGNGNFALPMANAGTNNNTVQGNYIGTNAAGTASIANGNGLSISSGAQNNTIGGTTAAARNIISGHSINLLIFDLGSNNNTIQGNYIGTDATGSAALPGNFIGISLSSGAQNNTIGGTAAGAGNVISGNSGVAIFITDSNTGNIAIQGNLIGTTVAGNAALPNGVGIIITGSSSNNMIGGTAASAANVIAFNGDDGIAVSSGTGNAIRSNSIFSNSGLGIDLDPNGVTLNDACDGDTGANNLQNFPVILGSGHTASTITIEGILNSTPSTTFSLDFFANSSCDPLGYGEGATYLGTATVMTNGNCGATFIVTFNAVVSSGQVITATATDPTGNTSEFSQCSAPTAAPASINGQITTADGRPVGGVIMTLTGGAQVLRAITNAEGNYSFINVETDHFYSVTPQRANYLFSPGERSFTLLANKTDAVFTAVPILETANSLDTTEFFVRQNYLDFLGREPEQGGLDYWSGEIHSCNGDEHCINARRIGVAAAFFIEEEFQKTGSFVYRLYKGSLERQPTYAEFTVDRKLTAGNTVEERQAAFAEEWVGRAAFSQRYPDAMTAAQFVNRLFDTAGLAPYGEERRQEIEAVLRGKTRAQVLRDMIEISEFRKREYNPSFVLMEYFGYLRRDPDREGYEFWLETLNNRVPDNYTAMVCAFITSREYQQRFSSIVTRSNRDCAR